MSVPIGLYAAHHAGTLHVGELLVVVPAEPLASILDQRRYLPKGVLLLKRVVALPGQSVCRNKRTITDCAADSRSLRRFRGRSCAAVWDFRDLDRGVMCAESCGEMRAISPKGAMGLMQIMPETWTSLRVRYGLGADPYDPNDNLLADAAYLRELHGRYGAPGFRSAYNAAPTRYEDHLDGPGASGGDTRLRRRCRSVERRRRAR